MWTVQEFAASIPIVFWGDTEQTSGTGALRAIREAFEKQPFLKSGSRFKGRLHWTFQGFNRSSYEMPLLSNSYVHISRMSSTDGRDKVFALKGLFAVALRDLKVDYNRPLWEVYAEATRLTMIDENSLHMLQFVARSQGETRLPSWTVDWDYKLSHALNDHQASKGTRSVFQFGADGRVLQLSGILVSELSANISSLFPQFDISSMGFVFQGNPIDNRMRSRTCLRILFDFYQQQCKSKYPDFANYFQDITKFLDPENKYNTATQSIITHISEGHEHTAMLEIGEDVLPFLNKLNGTVLFMTTDDRFGIARQNGIQRGDRIALVSGFGNPLILRPASTGFILLSSSIISGLMIGELWPDDPGLLSHLDIV